MANLRIDSSAVMQNKGEALMSAPPVSFHDEDIVIIRNLWYVKPSMPINDDMLILLCCLKGRMNVSIEEKTYHVEENELLVILPKETIDSCVMTIDQNSRIVCLSRRFVECFMDKGDIIRLGMILRKNPLIELSHEKLMTFVHLLETVNDNLKDSMYYKRILTLQIEVCLYDIIGVIDKKYQDADEVYTSNNNQEEIFKNFITLIRSTKAKKQRVTYYADRLFISPKYLSWVVKEVSGKTSAEIINEFAIDDIKYCLRSTNKSLKEISLEQGFTNQSHFGVFFKRNMGCSASAYRENIKNRKDEMFHDNCQLRIER